MRQALLGGAYQAHSVIASAQRSLNLFSEPIPENLGEPAKAIDYPTPGLRLLSTVGTGPIRGIRQATNGTVYVVSGSSVYSVNATTWAGTSLGTITAGIRTPVSMADNTLDLVIVDGTAGGWTVNLAANTFAPLSDPHGLFEGADRVDYVDTYLIFNKPNTPRLYWSLPLSTAFDDLASDWANKSIYTDLLMTQIVSKREIWLIGQQSTEVWYDTGATDIGAGSSQFAPVQSVFIDHGTCAKYSVAGYDNAVFWLTRDRAGQGFVVQGSGYQTKRVSTYAIEAEIAGYSRIDDAIGFCYQMSGHTFYVITFPAADHTWVYDVTTGLWHEWAWIDTNGNEHRHRANCCWPVNGSTVVVGDWQNGNLYALDRQVFTDNGHPIKRARSFPHILHDGGRVYYRQFLADMDVGTAPPTAIEVAAIPGVPGGFTPLPLMAGGGREGTANAISGDGHTSVGWVSVPEDDTFQVACYWIDGGAPVVIAGTNPEIGDFAQALDVSGDGSIIVGVILLHHAPAAGGNFSQPFRWTAAGGLETGPPFSDVPGEMTAISRDGSRIGGYSTILLDFSSPSIACYWDNATLVRTALPLLPGHTTSYCSAISADGSVIVGNSQTGLDINTSRAWRWTAATGTVDLGLPFGAVWAQANGVSGDGTMAAGIHYVSPGVFGCWTWTAAGGFVLIPIGAASFHNCISSDGTTVIGDSNDGTNSGASYLRGGVLTVPTPVELDPVNYPGECQNTSVYGVSADGMVMVGASNPGITPHYLPYVYRVPIPAVPGTATTIVEDDLISLRWSDDRGHSWGNPVSQNIGKIGEYRASLQWQRLAYARDRCFELSWSVAMPTALQGCWIEVTPAQS